jgi:hypothetical protein
MSATRLYEARAPRFNHVAMSMPSPLLESEAKEDIVRFWGEVFGFDEIPQMTDPGKRLVLSAQQVEQFVFLIADDQPMACPRLDHYGISVGSRADLDAAWARAQAFQQRDERVDLIAPHVDDWEVVKIHAFYAGYLLPMMLEVQYWEYAE